jgi:uncharacterized membrane protein
MTNVYLVLIVQFVELNTVYHMQAFNAGMDDVRSVNLFLLCSFCANSNVLSVHSLG